MAKIKRFFNKIKDWFVRHRPTRRRIIQLYAALLTNANLKGFKTGIIYQGATKNLCVPGLNCYSCPGAIGACPLGSLQNALAASSTRTPVYVLGILMLFGLLLGRTICGFLCPVGLGQDLLYKIKSPKLKKSRVTYVLSYFKYVVLALTIAIPLIYQGVPFFCKYICPAGTFEGGVGLLANPNNADFFGMLGPLFTWKFALLVLIVAAAIFIYRFFCRFFCPLGAIYGLFNKIALLGVKLDEKSCVDCGLCISTCKMDVRKVGDHECINCGECIGVCPTKAISWKGSNLFLHNDEVGATSVDAKTKVNLLAIEKNAVQSDIPAITDLEPTVENSRFAKQDGAADAKDCAQESKKIDDEQAIKPKKKIQRRTVLEIIAWSLASIILVGALLYYNVVPTNEIREGIDVGNRLSTFNAQIYGSDEEFVLKTDKGEGSTVIVLWNGSNEGKEQISNVLDVYSALTQTKTQYEAKTKVVVVNPVSMDLSQTITDEAWTSNEKIIFAKDSTVNGIIDRVHKDSDEPLTYVLDANGVIKYKEVGVTEDYKTEVMLRDPFVGAKKGDFCYDFDLDIVYRSASTMTDFSIELARGKVTVINYWYTTCDPCVAEIPHFEEVFNEYASQINMVAIHSYTVWDGVEETQSFIDKSKVGKESWSDYTMLFAQDISVNTFKKLGGKSAYPMTVVLDEYGVVVSVNQGRMSADELRAAINEAIEYNS